MNILSNALIYKDLDYFMHNKKFYDIINVSLIDEYIPSKNIVDS